LKLNETDAKKLLTAPSPLQNCMRTPGHSSYYVDEDYPAGPEILITSPRMKLLTWLRIVHSGD